MYNLANLANKERKKIIQRKKKRKKREKKTWQKHDKTNWIIKKNTHTHYILLLFALFEKFLNRFKRLVFINK